MWNGGYWNGGPGGEWILFPIVMMIVMLIAFRAFGGMMSGPGGWFNAGRRDAHPTADAALETLRGRFARGDIDEQEYETKRALLTRDSSAGGGR